jgi:hypothetical protein
MPFNRDVPVMGASPRWALGNARVTRALPHGIGRRATGEKHMRQSIWITVAAALTIATANVARGDEKVFSVCRIDFMANWVAANCPGQIGMADVAKIASLRAAAGGTSPDCYRGEGDARNDVERLVGTSGKAFACSFYSPILKKIIAR